MSNFMECIKTACEQSSTARDEVYQTYLGANETAPTTDLKGDALTNNAWYFNTIDEKIYFYKNGLWVTGAMFVIPEGASMSVDELTNRFVEISTCVIDTVADLLDIDTTKYTSAVVREQYRGGTFAYDSSRNGENDEGTVFNGWCRQYDGQLNIQWFGASDLINDNEVAIQKALSVSSSIYIPIGDFQISSAIVISDTRDVIIAGESKRARIINTGIGNAIYFKSIAKDDRIYNIKIKDLSVIGNVNSLSGIQIDRAGWYEGDESYEVATSIIENVDVIGHGLDGIRLGINASESGAGQTFKISSCTIQHNKNDGISMFSNTNMVNVNACMISNNGRNGIYLNHIVSTNSFTNNYILDNEKSGIYALSAEEPLISYNGFNRNGGPAISLVGSSVKSVEAAVIFGNLFGDNGKGLSDSTEISSYYSKGTTIHSNYFYATGQDRFIYLSNFTENCNIFANHFKDVVNEELLVIKDDGTGITYNFEYSRDGEAKIYKDTNMFIENKTDNIIFFRNKKYDDGNPMFSLNFDGKMQYGGGVYPADVTMYRSAPGKLKLDGTFVLNSLIAQSLSVTPTADSLGARIYYKDEELKVILPSGIVRTITLT